MTLRTILVTGGAGFIGSAVCRHLVQTGRYRVVNVDKLTYAGNLQSLRQIENSPDYSFFKADIRDDSALFDIMQREEVDAVMHLAAESHVDRSIYDPAAFVETNIVGTFRLLNAALRHYHSLSGTRAHAFRFHHVSTDEVFGDLPFDTSLFAETSPYAPSSPYSASKAASDHLVRAWHCTYGLPTITSNCSNNYGAFQFAEKLIPLMILNALDSRPLPVYGTGTNVRDWLYVDDHAKALLAVLERGAAGESYAIGGRAERSNLDVVHAICALLDERRPRSGSKRHGDLIAYVTDRPGHDRRYAIDPAKIETALGWTAEETFETGLAKTVDWYLCNEWWWRPMREPAFAAERLGA